MTILECENLTKRKGGKTLINGFSMRLESGHIYGLIGKRGAGKTSIMRTVMGLTKPNSGTVRWSMDRRRVGAYVGDPAFHRELNIRNSLITQAPLLPDKIPLTRIDELMDRLKISPRFIGARSLRMTLINHRYSAGLAMAMLGQPDMLVLDEPFLGLDLEWADAFRDLFLEEIIAHGKSALLSAKTENELEGLATDFIHIEGGKNA